MAGSIWRTATSATVPARRYARRVGLLGIGGRLFWLAGAAALALAASSTLGAPPAAAGVSSEQAVAFLNQQRASNGIPEVVADPNLALGCQQHNRYMHANEFGHGENPDNPNYTPEGAGQGPYGGSEVLAWGDGFPASGENPWEWAPIHLYLLLDPEATRAGYDANFGFACMRDSGQFSEEQSSTPQFFSYPGPGSVGIYPDEHAAEWPYTPQMLAGIPENNITGTNILLFSLGTQGLQATGFSLSGPAGPVPARIVDETTKNEVGSGSWFRHGGVIVPLQPLTEHTAYTVSVDWRNRAYQPLREEDPEAPLAQVPSFHQEFSFTTGSTSRRTLEERPWLDAPLHLHQVGRPGRFVRLRLTAGKVLRGHSARFAVFRQERGCGPAFSSRHARCGWRSLGGRETRALRLRRSQILRVRAPRRWQKITVKARTKEFEVGRTRYAAGFAKFVLKR